MNALKLNTFLFLRDIKSVKSKRGKLGRFPPTEFIDSFAVMKIMRDYSTGLIDPFSSVWKTNLCQGRAIQVPRHRPRSEREEAIT